MAKKELSVSAYDRRIMDSKFISLLCQDFEEYLQKPLSLAEEFKLKLCIRLFNCITEEDEQVIQRYCEDVESNKHIRSHVLMGLSK